jgi:glycine/D-amino acid oxidase-like deaminating enzyme
MDAVILGHGLAGAVLRDVLHLRGLRVLVHDSPRDGRASRVAGGVVNPVVLRRLVLSWRASEFLPIAAAFYRAAEVRYDRRLWHPLVLRKLFADERERDLWSGRCADPAIGESLSMEGEGDRDLRGLRVPHGCGSVIGCAWLDVPAFLDAQEAELRKSGDWIADPREVDAHHREGAWVIECTGPFSRIPGLVPVKGETLTVRIPGLHTRAMVHRGAFLLPLGEERFRVGATFAWENVWSGPSDVAREELLRRVRTMTDLPVEVLDQQAGVRPTARDRRPLLGRHAAQPRQAVFNGLGSRGVLLAPWCAMHLADHLFAGAALDPEVDVARFA